jgi:putative lipoprotein
MQGPEDVVDQTADEQVVAADARLIGARWQWVRTVTPVELIEVSEPARYTLLLHPGGQAELQFDCNAGSGEYEIIAHQLSFGPLAATRMACPPDSQDAVFMKQLGQVTTYFVNDGILYLEMPMDSGTMRFEPAAAE